MSQERMRWAELLDVLTDSDRKRNIVIERATETERLALFLLRRIGWSAHVSPIETKEYDLEILKPGEKAAVQVRNQRAKVHLGQIEKFLDFLAHENPKNYSEAMLILATIHTAARFYNMYGPNQQLVKVEGEIIDVYKKNKRRKRNNKKFYLTILEKNSREKIKLISKKEYLISDYFNDSLTKGSLGFLYKK